MLAILVTIVKYRWIPASKHVYVPNMVAIGIAFILNTATYPTAMAFGSTVAYVWQSVGMESYAMYCYAVAAGGIAGEGLGGIVGKFSHILRGALRRAPMKHELTKYCRRCLAGGKGVRLDLRHSRGMPGFSVLRIAGAGGMVFHWHNIDLKMMNVTT